MRFHVVGIPHPAASDSCAHTVKVLDFCKMMRGLGHEVIHYGAEGDEADCSEHVTVLTAAEQDTFFGAHDQQRLPPVHFDAAEPYWQLMNIRAAAEIQKRLQRRDFLCLIAGTAQKPIADLIGDADCITVEYAVGYYGVFAKYRVFASYTHQACVYGQRSSDPDGFLYDAVIPHYYDPADFPFCENPAGDYLLFLGRLVQRKGIRIALATARAARMRLVLAGKGVTVMTTGMPADWLQTEEGIVINLDDQVQYAGYVDNAERAALIGNARAVLMPTLYTEPFGSVCVESQFTGTPVISTDFAAFSETIQHGVTGYRCSTLADFVRAVDDAESLDRSAIRDRAMEKYSLAAVAPMYERYFEKLDSLWGAGWPDMSSIGARGPGHHRVRRAEAA